eukprot:s247_g5.t1
MPFIIVNDYISLLVWGKKQILGHLDHHSVVLGHSPSVGVLDLDLWSFREPCFVVRKPRRGGISSCHGADAFKAPRRQVPKRKRSKVTQEGGGTETPGASVGAPAAPQPSPWSEKGAARAAGVDGHRSMGYAWVRWLNISIVDGELYLDIYETQL